MLSFSMPLHAKPSAQEQITKAVQAHFAQIGLSHGVRNLRVELQIPTPEAICGKPYIVRINPQRNLGKVAFHAQCVDKPTATFSMQSRIKIYAPIPTAKHDLASGKPIQAQDLILAEQQLTSWNKLVLTPEHALDKSLRRRVRAGQPILQKSLRSTILVKRGQSVQIKASMGGIMISAPAVAITAGALGDMITIKNSTTGKTLSAHVTAAGEVTPLAATE
ncbi:flagella basal body P-ring formation protein FlgA [Chromobacterium haemolyticum]|nr:flagella basal body P-ring formation protein FlgA [Chromobacterium haemolyticum]